MFSAVASAQTLEPPETLRSPLDASGKSAWHARQTFGPTALAGSAFLAGISQGISSPSGWPDDASGYGRRLASTITTNSIRHSVELGLDLATGEDPRYVRSGAIGFAAQASHAVVYEFVARTPRGRHLAYSRLGSALAAGFAYTAWYPDPRPVNGVQPARPNRVGLGLEQAGIIVGLDILTHIGAEIRPRLRKKARP